MAHSWRAPGRWAMESPPPRGPGPVVLATDVASLSVTIARTESRGPRAFPARREHSVLRALRVCLEARHPLRRGALTVAVVDLTPGKHSSEMDAFLAACARELGPGGGRDARRVVPCDADDADDAAFVASEAHLVAVCARAADNDDDARRCPPRLLAALARARSGGAAIVAVGRAAIRAVGPGSGGANAFEAERQKKKTTAEDDVKDARAAGREEKAPPFLVPVVARVASAPSAKRPKSSPAAAARDWRRLTRELFGLSHRNGVCHATHSGEAPFSLTKNKVVGLGLVPGGCAACFADGSVEALVEDAVRFERADGFGVDPAKTLISGSSPAVFRRVVLRAGLALFGGGVSAAESTARDREGAEGTADGARLRPPAPPPRLIPTDTETLSRRHASCACLFDAETLVSAEWWPFWSGARAAAAASVERAARLLARPSVSRVVFFTGAGASAESGMPAFRETVPGAVDVDADGVRVGPATPLDALLPIWKTHDPEKYSTLSAFREDPGLCWFLHRRMFDQICGLRPNDAHVAIETLAGAGVPDSRTETETKTNENAYPDLKETAFEVTVVTQNIDGLHQAAAAASRTSTRTIELHGSTRRVACLERCGWSEDAETFLRLWDQPATRVREKARRLGAEEEEDGERRAADGERKRRRKVSNSKQTSDGNAAVGSSRSNARVRTRAFPTCGGCGVAPAKPACVFFGEALPDAAVKAARAACARAHAVVIVGTSLSVFPAADLPQQARVHTPRAPIVRVDACASATSTVGPDDAVITRRAARAVPALVRRVLELRDGSRGYVAEDAEGAEGGIGRPVASAAPRMFS